MNRSLLVLGITLAAALPARADLTHRIQSSVQLEVGGASTRAVRVGNSYSVSGSGISTTDGSTNGVIGGLGAHTNGVNALTPVVASQATSGNAFSFENTYMDIIIYIVCVLRADILCVVAVCRYFVCGTNNCLIYFIKII